MSNPEVTQASFLTPAVLAALLVGGCAQTPPRNSPTLAALATRYGVSQELLVKAGREGYFPESHRGKTFFCTQQAQSFSYVPRAQCFDPAQMTARLQLSAAALGDLQQRVLSAPPAPRSGAN